MLVHVRLSPSLVEPFVSSVGSTYPAVEMSDEYYQLSVAYYIPDREQTLEQPRVARRVVHRYVAGRSDLGGRGHVVRDVELAAKLREPVVGVVLARVVKRDGRVSVLSVVI